MTKDATTQDMTTKDMTTQDTTHKILDLWKAIPRDGVDGLIKFLQESDFFSAPCSTQFHLACPGGLARHSLNVYQLLKEKVERFAVCVPHESVVIAGLGHDLCKVNFYKEGGESCTEAQHNYLSSLAKQYGWKCASFKERFMPDGKLKRDIPAAQASILDSPYKIVQALINNQLQGTGTSIRYFQFSSLLVNPIFIAGVNCWYLFLNFDDSCVKSTRRLLWN